MTLNFYFFSRHPGVHVCYVLCMIVYFLTSADVDSISVITSGPTVYPNTIRKSQV